MNGVNAAKWLIPSILCLAAAGCAQNVVRSDHVEVCQLASKESPCSHGIPVGLAYSLPKGQVLLAAFRKPITAADIGKAQTDLASAQQAVSDTTTKLSAAKATQAKNAVSGESDAQKTQDKAAVDAAQAALTAAQALAESAKQNLETLKGGLPKTAAELQKAKDDVTQAQKVVDEDTIKLAKAQKTGDAAEIQKAQTQLDNDRGDLELKKQTQMDVEASKLGKFVETFTLTPQAIIPDDTQRFVANLDHGRWRDDTFKLSVVNGLLTSTNTQSTDQTSNIISSLASAAIGIITFAGAGIPVLPTAVAGVKGPALGPPPQCDYVYAKTFDPTNADEVNTVNTDLHAQKVQAHLQLQSTFVGHETPITSHHIETYQTNPTRIDGLVYRAAAGVGVQVLPYLEGESAKYCLLQAAPQAQSVQVFVPDTNAEFIAPAQAGALTTSSFQFNFSNGMLADYNLTRPSEVAAAASIPVDIVNKIMTIPTSILKLRLDYSTAQTNLASQQAALITAQGSEAIALVNAKTALETAETNLATADLNEPTARYKALTGLVQAKQALADAIAAAAKSTAAATQPAATR